MSVDAPETGATLRARFQAAMLSARDGAISATLAAQSSRERRAESVRLQQVGRRGRASSRLHQRYFRLEGSVGDCDVLAVLRGGELIADEALLRQAELVVALGESFVGPSGEPIRASLEGPPVPVMLTLIRACDRASAVEFGPAPAPDRI